MRNVWWLAFGLVTTAAACGSDDDGAAAPNGADGGDGDGGSTSSGGGASSGGSSSSSGQGESSSSSSSSSGQSSSSGGSSSGDLDASAPGDASADASDAEPDAAVPPVFVYAKFDVNHLLVAGQSNALGIGGGDVLDLTPRGAAACTAGTLEACSGVMFSSGVFPSTSCVHDNLGCAQYQARNAFAPLVEGDTYENTGSYALETPGSALANQAASLAEGWYFPGATLQASGVRMLVSNHARSGNSYECIRKGSCPGYYAPTFVVPATVKKAFEDGIDQVEQAKAVAAARNWSYAVRGVFLVHGESNHNVEANYRNDEFPMNRSSGAAGSIDDYGQALLEWQSDYETDIVAKTQQAVPVPLYLTQMTNWTWSSDNPAQTATRSVIPGFQLDAFRARPDKIILVTPTYPFPTYDTQADKVHFPPSSSRRIGEYFGKAYAQTTFTGMPWKPLYPLAASRLGAVITVRYHVPVLPLRFDTVAVSDPNAHRGFSFQEDGPNPAVVQSEVIDGDKVIVTLSKTPAGANKRIRYAYDGVPGAAGGPFTGPRGNLRDSDATASNTGGVALVNWSVAYDEPVD